MKVIKTVVVNGIFYFVYVNKSKEKIVFRFNLN